MLNVFLIVRKKEAGIASRRFREDFPSHQGDPILSVEISNIIAYSPYPDKGVFSKICRAVVSQPHPLRGKKEVARSNHPRLKRGIAKRP